MALQSLPGSPLPGHRTAISTAILQYIHSAVQYTIVTCILKLPTLIPRWSHLPTHLVITARWGCFMQAPMKRTRFSCRVFRSIATSSLNACSCAWWSRLGSMFNILMATSPCQLPLSSNTTNNCYRLTLEKASTVLFKTIKPDVPLRLALSNFVDYQ